MLSNHELIKRRKKSEVTDMKQTDEVEIKEKDFFFEKINSIRIKEDSQFAKKKNVRTLMAVTFGQINFTRKQSVNGVHFVDVSVEPLPSFYQLSSTMIEL